MGNCKYKVEIFIGLESSYEQSSWNHIAIIRVTFTVASNLQEGALELVSGSCYKHGQVVHEGIHKQKVQMFWSDHGL